MLSATWGGRQNYQVPVSLISLPIPAPLASCSNLPQVVVNVSKEDGSRLHVMFMFNADQYFAKKKKDAQIPPLPQPKRKFYLKTIRKNMPVLFDIMPL